MHSKYGEIPQSQIHNEKKKLQSAIFICLPYKESNYPLLDEYFDALLFRLNGLNQLFQFGLAYL